MHALLSDVNAKLIPLDCAKIELQVIGIYIYTDDLKVDFNIYIYVHI